MDAQLTGMFFREYFLSVAAVVEVCVVLDGRCGPQGQRAKCASTNNLAAENP